MATKWYGYEMLQLKALNYFDFALKVDCDTAFNAPVRPTPAEMMIHHGAYYMHTGDVFRTNPRCDATVDEGSASPATWAQRSSADSLTADSAAAAAGARGRAAASPAHLSLIHI